MLKIFDSEFGTMGMRRLIGACTDEFLATITEGAVHGVYKAVTWTYFHVTRRHNGSEGNWTFHYCVTT